MKFAVAILCILWCSTAAYAADRNSSAGGAQGLKSDMARHHAEGLVKATEKGAFRLEMVVGGAELKKGANTFDIIVRDKAGKHVKGAELSVIPWMPTKGQGVWEKPAVTERSNGRYHVENITIIAGGHWDLKVTVRKGAQEDRAVFSFNVAEKEQASQKEPEKTAQSYSRKVTYYTVPNVTLLNQDGKKVKLRALIESGKPVMIDFIYTTCTTICPVLSAGFSNLRTKLGKDASKVQLISISIDPDHDRPEQMKEYLSRFNAGDGWDFLTGSRTDIDRVLKALDAVIVDKMSHEPLYLLHGPNSDDWVRIHGLLKKSDLMNELRRLESK